MKELKIKIKARIMANRLCAKCDNDYAIAKVKVKYLYSKRTYLLCETCLLNLKIKEVLG